MQDRVRRVLRSFYHNLYRLLRDWLYRDFVTHFNFAVRHNRAGTLLTYTIAHYIANNLPPST